MRICACKSIEGGKVGNVVGWIADGFNVDALTLSSKVSGKVSGKVISKVSDIDRLNVDAIGLCVRVCASACAYTYIYIYIREKFFKSQSPRTFTP